MTNFRTELIPTRSSFPITGKDKMVTIGSCFAESIGDLLKDNKFLIWNNGFGTVYNPRSIHQLLLYGLEKALPSPETYLEREGVHLHYHFHSSFSSLKKEELQRKIKFAIEETHSFLKTADRIIITYGTAFVYRLKMNNEVIANCHKGPADHFTKSFLSEKEIIKSFQDFYRKLKTFNPSCKIILTVSPVRHLKDTLELNSVSKSILRLSCHSIINQFHDVDYFPAYEIVLDDLRDYRFYKTDRLHPTEEAIEYIWEKFIVAYFDEPTKNFISEWQAIKKDLMHHPLQSESESHQKFLKTVLYKLEKIAPSIDLSKEIQEVKARIQI